jgi:putative DNA primase/helicase
MSKEHDLVLSRDDPHVSAQEFRKREHKTILKYQEDWLDYDGIASYQMIEDDTIESEIQLFLQSAEIVYMVPELDAKGEPVMNSDGSPKMRAEYKPFNPKDNDVKQVNLALERQFHIKVGKLDPPAWLDGATAEQRKHDPKNIIACQNGLLDIAARVVNKDTGKVAIVRELLPRSPHFFTRTALAINYSPNAPKPERWLTFLQEVLGDDAAVIDLMQQAMGYLISGDISLQTIMYFRGKSRGGKGTILKVLDGLVGHDNIANPSLRDLSVDSGRQDLIGKSLAMIRDMNTDSKDSVSTAATHLATIAAAEPISIFRKFKGAVNLILKCRFILAGISLPNFGDHATSLDPRLIVFPFPTSFAGREDYSLDEKLAAELPGILNWALDGLDLLKIDGRFYEPLACVKAKHDIIHGSDPIRGFGSDRCEFDPAYSCSKGDVFAEYVEYCSQIEAHPVSRGAFYGKFMVAYPQIGESRPGSDGDRKPRTFTGVRIASDEHATTLTKVYMLDPTMLALGLSRYDEDAILTDARGEWVEQGEISE